MKKSTALSTASTATAKGQQQPPQHQSKKQGKKSKEKLAFDIPYDVDVPSLEDAAKISAIMGLVGQLIFATSNTVRPAKLEEPPRKKAKKAEGSKEGEEKEKRNKRGDEKEKETNDLRMFVVGVNAVSRIVEKEESIAKEKVRCVAVVSPSQPASENFVARHIAMCCAGINVPVCVLDTTSAELGKAFQVPSVMAFAVKTESFFNSLNSPKPQKLAGESEVPAASEKEVGAEAEADVKRRNVADNLVSLMTECQSKISLPWSGSFGELKPLKASPLKRNPSRTKPHPRKKQQNQKATTTTKTN